MTTENGEYKVKRVVVDYRTLPGVYHNKVYLDQLLLQNGFDLKRPVQIRDGYGGTRIYEQYWLDKDELYDMVCKAANNLASSSNMDFDYVLNSIVRAIGNVEVRTYIPDAVPYGVVEPPLDKEKYYKGKDRYIDF